MTLVKSYKVAHILVPNKHEAEDIIRKIRLGADFQELARKFSSCASAVNGGDLGIIKLGKAHEDFEEAALKLNPGEILLVPVRTSFGYHIIRRLG
jgi:peptidylprolyl isomerase/peptidyl-prolyl cis-trans isomerase C